MYISLTEYFVLFFLCLGLPMLAAAYTQRTEWQNLCWLFLVVSIISVLLHCIQSFHLAVRDFCAAISILFILFSSVFLEYRGQVNKYGLGGGCCFILSAVISDQGRGFQNIKNVDLFHYVMAVGICLLSEGLLA